MPREMLTMQGHRYITMTHRTRHTGGALQTEGYGYRCQERMEPERYIALRRVRDTGGALQTGITSE